MIKRRVKALKDEHGMVENISKHSNLSRQELVKREQVSKYDSCNLLSQTKIDVDNPTNLNQVISSHYSDENCLISSKQKLSSSKGTNLTGDSRNYTNSISFKNFKGSDKSRSSHTKKHFSHKKSSKSIKEMNRISNNELKEFYTHNLELKDIKMEMKNKEILNLKDQTKSKISGFTQRELNSLMQLKFLKKKIKS